MRLLPRWHTPESVVDRLIRGFEDGSVTLETSPEQEELSALLREAGEYRLTTYRIALITALVSIASIAYVVTDSALSTTAKPPHSAIESVGVAAVGLLFGFMWGMVGRRSLLKKTGIVMTRFLSKVEGLDLGEKASEAMKADNKVTT